VNPRNALRASAAIVLLVASSCASGAYISQTPSMPAARAALRPEHRLFYDALIDYGDWVLIEPYGFMFRPRVDFASFRPYGDGFWAASDPWGWVWISAEPFGWATYHYGFWTWDRFQGWVWGPGVDWGPAWVTWEIAGGFAGWAPLGPSGGDYGAGSPGGGWLFAPIDRLGATDIRAHAVTRAGLGAAAASAQPVENLVERDGVRYNFGPDFATVERLRGGPIPRVKIEDALAPGAGPGAGAGRRKEAAAETPGAPRIEATREAGNAVARQARELIQRGGASPARLPLLRPAGIKAPDEPDDAKPARPAARKAAAPDTTR
jgi:uncharacterized protein DUF6600